MGIIDFNEVCKKFNGEVLFDNITFSLNKYDKLALIGNNGVGKTTLLKMLLKQLDIDGGSINIAGGVRIGYLSQNIIQNVNNSLYEEMLSCFSHLTKLEDEIESVSKSLEKFPTNIDLIEQLGNLQIKYEHQGGYEYIYKINTILKKFGFKDEEYNRKINTFSGGEKNKIAFSKLLLDNPEVLILDEPTNHLDMSTIEWLEDYLKNYDGSVIIVSHDRYFIDNVCNCLYEMVNGSGEYYKGNYTYYLNEKVIRYEQRLKQYNLQEKEIAHLKQLIAKFKPKPTKVSFAKDREKKLQRILDNKIEKPNNYNKTVKFDFKNDDNVKYRQIKLSNLYFGYDKPVSTFIDLEVFNGDKIGIIGENGIGKTTLLKTILKKLPPIEGKVIEYRGINYGYIDQNLISISSDNTLFDYIHEKHPYLDNLTIRSQLGKFLFSSDDVFKTVNQLSGGEKVRLVFAEMLLNKYDILLLDEPTNHLDIDTRKVLESSLKQYSGTIIFVSHDRFFVDELAERLVVITKEYIDIFEGNYSDYAMLNKDTSNESSKKEVRMQVEQKSKNVSKKSNKFKKEKLEKSIEKLNKEIEEKRKLISEDNDFDYLKIQEIELLISNLESELDNLENEYFELLEQE